MVQRRKTTNSPTPLTLGLTGTAEVDPKTLIPLLDDLVDDRDVTIYVPVSPESYTDTVKAVVKWAEENGIRLATVSTDDAREHRACQNVLRMGYDDFDADGDPALAVVELLISPEEEGGTAPEDARLLCFYNPESEEDFDAASLGLEKGVATYDAANALDLMTTEDEHVDSGTVVEEPAPPARTRKTAVDEAKETPVSSFEKPLTAEVLKRWTLVELKKLAREVNPENDKAFLSGKSKDFVIDLILLAQDLTTPLPDEDVVDGVDGAPGTNKVTVNPLVATETPWEAAHEEDPPDEAQTTRSTRAMRAAADEALKSVPDTPKRVTPHFDADGDMIAYRDSGDHIGRHEEAPVNRDSGEFGVELRVWIQEFANAFADRIVEEIRKPKPRGRPKKDS